ncbi:MAG TPA: hypothetical protein VN772_05265 [Solirubrobacteraceae bacterium]|nr:hypothetical protein [Solirubrobacteraceae bacterium]
MARRSAEQPPRRPRAGGASTGEDAAGALGAGGAASGDPPAERFGVLAIARHRKDDDRALILYARVTQDPE